MFLGGVKLLEKDKLDQLICACLLGDSEILQIQNNYHLFAYIEKSKFKYLENYIIKNSLNSFVKTNKHKCQIVISHHILETYYHSWYLDSKKIFSKRITPALLEYESVILYVILFGKRQVEGIKVTSNIDKNYLIITTYCIQSHLQTNLNFGESYIKILDIFGFIKKVLDKVQMNELIELFQYLTHSEVKKISNRIRLI